MITKRIVVRGRVQGIGYRPFVAEKAQELNIEGWVRNSGGIVTVLATGEEDAILQLERALVEEAPAGSLVTSIESSLGDGSPGRFLEMDANVEPAAKPGCDPDRGFKIIHSDQDSERKEFPLIPADLPTCDRCRGELYDSNNRRYRHPFISCTACGPRYSIIDELPYDRDTITMKDFDMCPDCASEYAARGNIRRHAQTIACKCCGPKLLNLNIEEAVQLLRQGGIVAVKDIGGYHLAASPFEEKVVANLRIIKAREKKPFAVLFPDVASVKKYCLVNEREEELLLSSARPIVLLRKRKEVSPSFVDSVCGTSPDIGAMLPCNPVQLMLTEELGPLIMTSGNVSGELMTIHNRDMEDWVKRVSPSLEEGVEIGILSHDRRIITSLDDSIVKVVRGKTMTLRRGRGLVPDPIDFPFDKQVLARGGDLKASFCYTAGKRAYVSQHFGDLIEESCLEMYESEQTRMKEIFGFEPELLAVDKHPSYRSAQLPGKINVALRKYQHHKAHVASVIAEHDLKGPVLGFAYDGTGFGEDGSVWGSESFYWDGRSMKRLAHLKPVKLIGGDEGARNCDTILAGYLYSLGIVPEDKALTNPLVEKALDMGINAITSSSMGRLFDAVSALLNICHYNSYEGQAAIELENLAANAEGAYELRLELKDSQEGLVIDQTRLFTDILGALEKGVKADMLAKGFIYSIGDAIIEIVERLCLKQEKIALSGGTFLNRILMEYVLEKLENKGYQVFHNEQLPPGDGGICLGQAYLACVEDDN